MESLTINGCVVSEGELREEVRTRLVSAGCQLVEASKLAAEVTQGIFFAWAEEDENDGD